MAARFTRDVFGETGGRVVYVTNVELAARLISRTLHTILGLRSLVSVSLVVIRWYDLIELIHTRLSLRMVKMF